MDYVNWMMTDDSGVESKNGYNNTMDKYIVFHKINSNGSGCEWQCDKRGKAYKARNTKKN